LDVGGLVEGGSRLGRATRRGAGYGSLGTGEAQVSLARGKARGRPAREAHLLQRDAVGVCFLAVGTIWSPATANAKSRDESSNPAAERAGGPGQPTAGNKAPRSPA
jgi:hypothetical protein